MPKGHAVVDGSNIATEGRTEPSLAQLREAVAEFERENDFKHVTVVVDASFEHRVSSREKKSARAAIDAGEFITPPAGVVGRGDAFILEVADRAKAVVLSNDSFQEFHGTYDWLFDDGRLIGGKPVPGVGWVYVARTPVRGPVSRRATKKSSGERSKAPAKKATTKKATTRKAATRKPADDGPRPAIGATKKAAAEPASTEPASTESAPTDGTNDRATWKTFRDAHPEGSSVVATVDRYSSHGAYGTSEGAVVYFPNRSLGDPAPNRARDVVSLGDTRGFFVQRYDEDRLGIDLGLVRPEDAAEEPTAYSETPTSSGRRARAEKTAKKTTKRASRTKKAATKTSTARKTTAKKSTRTSTAKKTTAKKTGAKKTDTKKSTPRKRTTKKSAKKSTTAAVKTTKKKAT